MAEYEDDDKYYEEDLEGDDEEGGKRKKNDGPSLLEKKNALVNFITAAIKSEKERREDPSFVPRFPRLTEFIMSTKFEAYMGAVILSNCVVIGVKASYDTPESDADDQYPIFFVLEFLFTIIFIIDISLRVQAYGWTWFAEAGNLADTLLVFLTGVLRRDHLPDHKLLVTAPS